MLGFRRLRYIGVGLALALFASACGDGENGADNPATTTTAPSPGATDGAATTTTMEPVSGDSGSTYCERVREAEASNETPLDFSFFGLSAAELEAQFSANLAVFEQWRDIAPSEIEDDANLVLDFYRTFVDRGNELNWDLEAMADDEAFNAGFDDPALDTAAVNLENYTRDVCGVDFNSTTDPGLPPGSADDDDPITAVLNAFQLPADLFSAEDIQCMRDELGAEFEAKIDADWVPSTDDITLILAAVDTCGIALG